MGDPHQVDGGLVNGVELSFPDVGDGEEIEPCLLAGRGELPRHGVDRRIAVDPLPTAFVDRTFGPKFKREVPVGQELLLSLQLIVLVVENSDLALDSIELGKQGASELVFHCWFALLVCHGCHCLVTGGDKADPLRRS